MTQKISETAFASQVEDLLRLYHWRWTHFRPAQTYKGWRTPLSGDKGLPDYICVRPPRLIFAELKDQYSKPSPEQEAWLDDLRECVKMITPQPVLWRKNEPVPLKDIDYSLLPTFEVYLWRPQDFDEIARILE